MAASVAFIKIPDNQKFIDNIDAKASVERMSVFECFAYVCGNITHISESNFGREFLHILYADLGADICIRLLENREVQKAIWRNIHGDHVDLPNFNSSVSTGITVEEMLDHPIDLNETLKKREDLPETLEVFIDTIPTSVLIDMSEFKYVTPDEYHAALAYRSLLADNDCDIEAFSALVGWIICRKAMKNKVKLYLALSRGDADAHGLMKLFERRRISLDVFLLISEANEALISLSAELCLNAYKNKKNVFPRIVIPKKTFSEKIEKKLLALLPSTRICICDV